MNKASNDDRDSAFVARSTPPLESPIEDDDGFSIATRADTNSAICRLVSQFPDGEEESGTGWLVGPRTIITAGHCIIHSKLKTKAIKIKIYVADFDGVTKVSPERTHGFEAVSGSDYGVIHLNDSIDGIDFFSIAVKDTATLKASKITVSGYPGEGTTFKGKTIASDRQYVSTSSVGDVTNTRIFYQADTFKGHSGSPVYIEGRQVVGIHVKGTDGGDSLNSAIRITDEVANTIKGWIQADAEETV